MELVQQTDAATPGNAPVSNNTQTDVDAISVDGSFYGPSGTCVETTVEVDGVVTSYTSTTTGAGASGANLPWISLLGNPGAVAAQGAVTLIAPIDAVFSDLGTLDELLLGLGGIIPTDASAIPNGDAPQAGGLATIAQLGNVAGPLCLFIAPGLTGGYFANWPGLGGGMPVLGVTGSGGITVAPPDALPIPHTAETDFGTTTAPSAAFAITIDPAAAGGATGAGSSSGSYTGSSSSSSATPSSAATTTAYNAAASSTAIGSTAGVNAYAAANNPSANAPNANQPAAGGNSPDAGQPAGGGAGGGTGSGTSETQLPGAGAGPVVVIIVVGDGQGVNPTLLPMYQLPPLTEIGILGGAVTNQTNPEMWLQIATTKLNDAHRRASRNDGTPLAETGQAVIENAAGALADPRVSGTLMVIQGGMEVLGGSVLVFAPEPVLTKAGGAGMVLHGTDTLVAGMGQIINNEPQETATAKIAAAGAEALGVEAETARTIGHAVDLGAGIASGAAAGSAIGRLGTAGNGAVAPAANAGRRRSTRQHSRGGPLADWFTDRGQHREIESCMCLSIFLPSRQSLCIPCSMSPATS